MKLPTEKPLLEVNGKPMIVHILEALRSSRFVTRIIVASSANTPRTANVARKLGVELVETPGEGYVEDMKHAIKRLGLGDVMVISADLPFITKEILDLAAEKYLSNSKPSLMVAAPVEVYRKTGFSPSYAFDFEGRKVAPIGLNVINGTKIDQPELDETVLVIESVGPALNVNTPRELELARRRN